MTIKTASSQTRFSKLDDGSWGVSSLPGELSTGERIRVQKANGEYKECTVGAVVHVDRGAWNRNAPNGREYRALARSSRRAGPGPEARTMVARASSLATDKQLRYIVALGGTPTDGMSRREASTMIDELKGSSGRLGARPSLPSLRSRDAQEIEAGEAACRLAQQAGPAGSEAREAAYLAQEMADYNMGL